MGRMPGLSAAPAAGCLGGLPRPVGHPRAVSAGPPVIATGQQPRARRSTSPRPTIHARAGAVACTDASLREAWPQQGMLPMGLPHTSAPLPAAPTPQDVLRRLREAGLSRARTACPGPLASACGDRRPVVERRRASLRGRGAARITATGDRGARVHRGMAVMAHHAATWVRIHEAHLSKPARHVRRRWRLRCRQASQCHASIN
jgi:hypothetical protein